jgi:hypothetical protein
MTADQTAAPGDSYRTRAARFEGERDEHARRARIVSHLRLAAFAAFVVCMLLLERSGGVWAWLGGAAAAAFVALIALHRRIRRRERWFHDLAALNTEGLDRLAMSWDRLPVRAPSLPVAGHAYAADLDLYGRASLSQIVGPVATPFGQAALDGWLLARTAPDVIRERQQAVRELAPLHELRDTLALHARAARTIRMAHIERFLHWAETPHPVPAPALLRVLSWLVPATTLLLIAAHAAGIIGSSLWLLPLALSLAAYFTVGARARRIFDEAFGREPLFTYYPDMIAAATQAPLTSPLLRSIAARFMQQGMSADRRLHDLQKLMHHADMRTSSMHLPVFLLTWWDIHILFALERWQRVAGSAVRDWLHALGELEALASLATLAHDHPDWTFPDVVPMEDPRIDAEALGHPLIRDDARVTNDVTVGPPGTFLLVTGSNMSGKSTLLRSLGVNAVLAQAGAPVCARTLLMPPLEVSTSIRVQDSLARGVSYFMAELERLKQIVDAAESVRADGAATQLFLLDEILHGTNTAERRIAATRVIRHLVETGAIGAATTHDLALAEEPDLAAAAVLVHFTESFRDVDGESRLSFDYRLRPGLATSTNALVLMRMVGLE